MTNQKELVAGPVPLNGEMDLEEFRRAGYQLIDWIAEYLDRAIPWTRFWPISKKSSCRA